MVKQYKLNIQVKEKIVNKNYNLFSDYLARNGFDRLLEEELGGMKAPWATYHMPTVCRILIDAYALGLRTFISLKG